MARANPQTKSAWKYTGLAGAALIICILVFAALKGTGQVEESPPVDPSLFTGEVQEVSLSVQGANYIMTPSELKVNVPVRMTADLSSVQGCARSIVIPEFEVQKNVAELKNVIEFVPTKTGEFEIMCSMRMYTGKFTVK